MQILFITADLQLVGHVTWLQEARIELVTNLVRWLAGGRFVAELIDCWAGGRVDDRVGTRSNGFVCDDVDFGRFRLVFGVRRFEKILVSSVVLCGVESVCENVLILKVLFNKSFLSVEPSRL